MNKYIKYNISRQEKDQRKYEIKLLFCDLPTHVLKIFSQLLKYKRYFHKVFPSQQTIADAIGVSRKTVNEWCLELERHNVFSLFRVWHQSHTYEFDPIFDDYYFCLQLSQEFLNIPFSAATLISRERVTLLNNNKELLLYTWPEAGAKNLWNTPSFNWLEVYKETGPPNEPLTFPEFDQLLGERYGDRVLDSGTTLPTERFYNPDSIVCSECFERGDCYWQESDQPISLLFGCL